MTIEARYSGGLPTGCNDPSVFSPGQLTMFLTSDTHKGHQHVFEEVRVPENQGIHANYMQMLPWWEQTQDPLLTNNPLQIPIQKAEANLCLYLISRRTLCPSHHFS